MLRGVSKACASAELVVAEKVMLSIWFAARTSILRQRGADWTSDQANRHNKKYLLAHRQPRVLVSLTTYHLSALRRTPPLNPLRVFETVARTENLTGAAHELHVTQSAVSRQIAVLEAYLGVELLRREDPEIRVKLDDGSLDAWQSLIAMSNANIFIGTNSKLSIWAIIFRALLLQEAPSYISTEVKHHVVANLADAEMSGVHFY